MPVLLMHKASERRRRLWDRYSEPTGRIARVNLAILLLVAFGMLARSSHAIAQAPGIIDLELVLAVDVSLSMDLDEQRLQRDGYIAAFRDGELHKAIQSGSNGRIAVIYVEWAGRSTQNVVVPWTVVDSPAAALDFAEKLEQAQISRARLTSISAGLLYAAQQFGTAGMKGLRRVIDVSGDGPNNDGPSVTATRDELVATGVVINALPIMLKVGTGGASLFDISNLDDYYSECVIGGPGAFMVPVRTKDDMIPAIRRKLLLEIAGLEPPARVIRAQVSPRDTPTPVDCLVGEKLWRRYMDGRF